MVYNEKYTKWQKSKFYDIFFLIPQTNVAEFLKLHFFRNLELCGM